MKKTFSILMFLVLVAGLVGAVYFSQQKQDTRSSAFNNGSSFSFQPTSVDNLAVGDSFGVSVFMNVGDQRVSAYKYTILYDPTSLRYEVGTSGVVFGNLLFNKVTDGRIQVSGYKVAVNNNLPTGTILLDRFYFTSLKPGASSITVGHVAGATDTQVTRSDPQVADITLEMTEAVLAVNSVQGTSGVGSTEGLPFKFKVSFSNVFPGAACANNMRVNVVVKTAEGDKSFSNVVVVGTGETNQVGFKVYQGQVRLVGVASGQGGVYALINGPKQIATKYSQDNQTAFFNQSGGAITLNTDENRVLNFSKLPLLGGDITSGSSGGTNDQKVDGADYAFVKSQFVLANGSTLADLDYDCKVTGTDMGVVQVSLNEKYSQLY